MIIITGAAGFIGSCLAGKLNHKSIKDLVLVDDFTTSSKKKNWESKSYQEIVNRDELQTWLKNNHQRIDFVFHIGARTDTTEFDISVFNRLNLDYSKMIWETCSEYSIPLIYASSAATYGMGEHGYKDDHNVVELLQPLNPYGESKNDFDKWVLAQTETPPFWAGLKFFNVYGPNEYHKGRMASVIFHAYHQIMDTGKMKLFRSHHKDYEDGKQLRDFIYVKDVVDVLFFLMKKQPNSGIYNLGTGKARTFLDLVKATFAALQKPEDIEFIDTPEDIRDKYQYFTEAKMDKLRQAGFTFPFYSLEEGISEYVREYLMTGKHF